MTEVGCLAWIQKTDNRLPFEGGLTYQNNPQRFYLPNRCRRTVLLGESHCAKCFKRRDEPFKGYTSTTLYWGTVTEPIRNIVKGDKAQKNQMAFSPWFFEMVKQHSISPENLQKATEAWTRATAGLNGVPPLPDIGEMPPKTPAKEKKTKATKSADKPVAAAEPIVASAEPVIAAPDTEKKPKGRKPKSAAIATEPTVVSADTDVPATEKAPKVKKRQPKTVAATPVAILSQEKPEELEVVHINVMKKELNGTWYYVDTSKSKVYDVKNGSYVGIWDTVTEKFVSRPDSDVE